MRRLVFSIAGWWLSLLGHRIGAVEWRDGAKLLTCKRCGTAVGIRRRWPGLPPAVAGTCPVARLYRWSRRAPSFVLTQDEAPAESGGPFR